MSEFETNVEENINVNKLQGVKCRACLTKIENHNNVCNIFQSWVPPWKGMGATIAEDLAKLANVEITEIDHYSKNICEPCYHMLLNSATFAAKVRNSDQLLKQQLQIHNSDNVEQQSHNEDKVWPQPIQVEKNSNSYVYQDLDVEVKQEVLSEDECNTNIAENSYNNTTELGVMDIKIEPEELVEAQPFGTTAPYFEPPPLMITSSMSLTASDSESKPLVNGMDDYEAIITDRVQNTTLPNGPEDYGDEHFLLPMVKEEPLSEEELYPDLPLDCLLCTKSFSKVSGLKAHVIAHHSYKSVRRKVGDAQSPEKKHKEEHRCQICGRAFVTSTDLMVHETCHNKHSCYGCTRKFDTFKHLSKHRKKCVLPLNKAVKPKTLEDVIRPVNLDTLKTPKSSPVQKIEDCSNECKLLSVNNCDVNNGKL